MKLPGLLVLAAVAGGCSGARFSEHPPPPIVGVWLVRAPEAPFPLHMFAFHADGTVEQSNPDAGNPRASDSNLMGAWKPDGGAFRGRLVEIEADRTTHQLLDRVQIDFTLRVTGDTFSGTAEARIYDADGRPTGGHVVASLAGERVSP